MARGGDRPGAGRPQGGYSEINRLMVDAIDKGLAIAGKSAGLPGNTDEELAINTAAQIAAEMIFAGRGDEVLKLRVLASSKSAANAARSQDKERGSLLLQALNKLPGQGGGTQPPLEGQAAAVETTEQGVNEGGQPDSESGTPPFRPVFLRQLPLVPEQPAGPPTPPSGPAPSPLQVNPENFEKKIYGGEGL